MLATLTSKTKLTMRDAFILRNHWLCQGYQSCSAVQLRIKKVHPSASISWMSTLAQKSYW